jgi:hypothetical protein
MNTETTEHFEIQIEVLHGRKRHWVKFIADEPTDEAEARRLMTYWSADYSDPIRLIKVTKTVEVVVLK